MAGPFLRNQLKFSPRDRIILELLSLGSSRKHIAYELELSVGALNWHVSEIARRAQVPRNQLMIYALQHPEALRRDGRPTPGLHPPGCPCTSALCKGRWPLWASSRERRQAA